jgi:hypothetical protein
VANINTAWKGELMNDKKYEEVKKRLKELKGFYQN